MTQVLPGVQLGTSSLVKKAQNTGAAQALVAATATILTGSAIEIPDGGLVPGAVYKAHFAMTKTAAGTATSAFAVGVIPPGEALLAANVDTILSFTKPAGTAAIDEGVVDVEVLITAIGGAEEGAARGEFVLTHNLAATGHAQVPVVALAGVDATLATVTENLGGGYIVLLATTGAADAITVNLASAELILPAAA